MPKQKYSVVSVFSGAMGLDLGLERTGKFEVRACVEWEPPFCATIRRNRDEGRLANRDLKVFEADIRELDPFEVLDSVAAQAGQRTA